MINKKLEKLGKSTETIGHFATFGSPALLYFLIILKDLKKIGKMDIVFPFLIVIVIIHFVGYAIYSLHRKHIKLTNGEITLQRFKIHWIACLFFSSIIVLISFLTLSQYIYGFIDGHYRLENITLLLLIPILSLIPQFILLRKTSKEMYNFKINKLTLLKLKNIQIPSVEAKIKELNRDEIIIISLVIGAITALLLGYIFCDTQYFTKKGVRVYHGIGYKNCVFNYVLAIGSFIIVSGISYIFIDRKNRGKT